MPVYRLAPLRIASIVLGLIILMSLAVSCKGGDGLVNPGLPPTVTFKNVKTLQYDSILPVYLHLESQQVVEISLSMEYKDGAGGAYNAMTPLPGRADPTTLQTITVPKSGTEILFWWHAVADLEYSDRQGAAVDDSSKHENVYIRATVTLPDGEIIREDFGPIVFDYEDPLDGTPPPYVPGSALPTAYCDQEYDVQLTAYGGTKPLIWNLYPSTSVLPWFLELTYDGHVLGEFPEFYGPLTISFVAMVTETSTITPRQSAGLFSISVECAKAPVPGCAAPPEISFDSLPDGLENQLYCFQCTANGGEGALSWSVASGSLPTWLDLSPSGVLSGTPLEGNAGTHEFTLQVCDSCTEEVQCDTVALSLTIDPLTIVEKCDDPPSITTESLPTTSEGDPYDFTLTATDGHGDLTWTIAAGSLPSGLVLTPAGKITGAAAEGTGGDDGEFFNFTARVCDSCPQDAQCDTRELALLVKPPIECAPPPVIQRNDPEDPSIDTALVDEPYTYQFQADGGEGALTWQINNPEILPASFNFSDAGLLSGDPTMDDIGPYALNITVTDSCEIPQSDNDVFDFEIKPPCQQPPEIVTESLPNGTEGIQYNFLLLAQFGEGTLTWEIIGGDLPAGLELTTGGALTGIPEFGTAGDYSGIEIQVSDECYTVVQSTSNLFNLLIEEGEACAPPPTITTETADLPTAAEGIEYNFMLEASDGEGMLSWEVLATNDQLPPGLVLGTDGTISGIPDAGAIGDYELNIQVCDSCDPAQCTSKLLTLTVAGSCDPGPDITTTGVDPAHADWFYSFQLESTGGDTTNGPLFWLLDDPESLPTTLLLTGNGLLEGTPEAADIGDYLFSVTVCDTCVFGPQCDSEEFTLTVLPASSCDSPPDITSGTSLQIPAGLFVDNQFTASDGHGNLTWTLEVCFPDLPATVQLTEAGWLIGTTTSGDAGVYALSVKVCDECDDPAPQCDLITFSLILVSASGCTNPEPSITDATVPEPTPDGSPYSYTMSATDGDPPLGWLAAGLPPGILIDLMTGELSGAVEAVDIGVYTIYIAVIDSCTPDSQAASKSYLWDLTD